MHTAYVVAFIRNDGTVSKIGVYSESRPTARLSEGVQATIMHTVGESFSEARASAARYMSDHYPELYARFLARGGT